VGGWVGGGEGETEREREKSTLRLCEECLVVCCVPSLAVVEVLSVIEVAWIVAGWQAASWRSIGLSRSISRVRGLGG
jgi:hypothetical protein